MSPRIHRHHRRSVRAVVAAAGLGLVAAPLALVAPAEAADPVPVNLLNINDFHGRIDANTVAFAGTVEQLRAEGGEANTLFLSAGDNIGASLFASSSAGDRPTIDVLEALEMRASAVGNHEFDQGIDDLTGRVDELADFPYLGANVYDDQGEPVLDEYATFEVNGLTVGVVGVVTQETPSLVSQDGIAGLTFGDPVAAVNRVAGELEDGDPANGEADVIVAEFHEGVTDPGDGTPDPILTGTSASVDAIFSGHTHEAYVYQAPVPGEQGETRPVVQTGSYGTNVGQIQLMVDPDTGEVTSSTARVVPRLEPPDTDGDGEISDAEQQAFDENLIAQYPRVAEVARIVDAALAAAEEVGRQPVGEVTEDITTAFTGGDYVDGEYTGGTRDDRSSESTLGHLVADMLRDTLAPAELGGAEIGITNPGGLRSELFYEGTGDPATDTDGVVTYAEANAVLPFVNNLWTLTLTGAQLEQVLEEQWQPAGADRPFLKLGLSDNVSVTSDPDAPEGERITSVRVDGEPLDPDREYRIGTFSFLAQGGDNFTTFAEGTDVQDSGLIDREGWIDYLGDTALTSPDFARRQVQESGMPSNVTAGESYSFTLENLDLTSLGSPVNTEVTATLEPLSGEGETVALGTFPVTDGTASIDLTAPRSVPEGYVVRLVAAPSGTTVTIPATAGSAKAGSAIDARAVPNRVFVDLFGPIVLARVKTEDGHRASGPVEVYLGDDLLGSDTARHGFALVRLDEFGTTGIKTLRVKYAGDETTAPSSTTVDVRVVELPGRGHAKGRGHGRSR